MNYPGGGPLKCFQYHRAGILYATHIATGMQKAWTLLWRLCLHRLLMLRLLMLRLLMMRCSARPAGA